MVNASLQAGLLAHLQRHDAQLQTVEALAPITTGASQELWRFDACGSQRRHALVLRRARGWNEGGPAHGVGMATEAALLRCARAHGVPVPGVFSELAEDDGLGVGYLMHRVEGETAGPRILRDPALAQARGVLLAQCAQALARLHRIPAEALPPLRSGQAAEELAHWAQSYRATGIRRPVFEVALRWLVDHTPAPVAPVLVHGDLRNGNLVVGEEGLRAVLDWELAHRGDPMEDLGWFCVNAWRFGEVAQQAGGIGTREDLFEAYAAAGGQRVDRARVQFWEVLGTLKWGIACDEMGRAWHSRQDRSIERLAIGQRAAEVAVDLLALLLPQAAPGAAQGSLPSSPSPAQQQALDIGQAVTELLTAELPALRGRANFDARIARRLLGVQARLLTQGPALEATERTGLAQLLGVPACDAADAARLRLQLCARIADADTALDRDALHAHLWRVALADLAILSPDYRWSPGLP
jgi:aminoglycoside phosphotransferase (APT) family kinase protein